MPSKPWHLPVGDDEVRRRLLSFRECSHSVTCTYDLKAVELKQGAKGVAGQYCRRQTEHASWLLARCFTCIAAVMPHR